MNTFIRTAAIAGVLLTGIGGTYLVATNLQASTQITPQQVADQFIRAVIRNDINQVGWLSGLDPSEGSALERLYGLVLGEAMRQENTKKARNPGDFKWTLAPQKLTAELALFNVDFCI